MANTSYIIFNYTPEPENGTLYNTMTYLCDLIYSKEKIYQK